jgi:hypothetical protein
MSVFNPADVSRRTGATGVMKALEELAPRAGSEARNDD